MCLLPSVSPVLDPFPAPGSGRSPWSSVPSVPAAPSWLAVAGPVLTLPSVVFARRPAFCPSRPVPSVPRRPPRPLPAGPSPSSPRPACWPRSSSVPVPPVSCRRCRGRPVPPCPGRGRPSPWPLVLAGPCWSLASPARPCRLGPPVLGARPASLAWPAGLGCPRPSVCPAFSGRAQTRNRLKRRAKLTVVETVGTHLIKKVWPQSGKGRGYYVIVDHMGHEVTQLYTRLRAARTAARFWDRQQRRRTA